jgi:type I restriction enzyme R subunit
VKTAQLVHDHISGVTVDSGGLESVAIDAGVFDALRQLELLDLDPDRPEPPTVEDVLDTLAARLARRLTGDASHPVWVSLSARLEALRQAKIDSAAASVEFLKQILELARDLVAAEQADDVGRLDEVKVIDPDRGALTQILEEYAPENVPVIIETVVEQIDAIVRPVRGTGWQDSQPNDRKVRQEIRLILRNNGLPVEGELFDRAYDYIRKHY